MPPSRKAIRRQVMGPDSAPESESDSIIKVLISTDNHLGYLEKDPVRGDDSFRAFEEVLHIAKANNVDMVLLGGDLFHDNKPTRSTIVKTMRLLRSVCLSRGGSIPLAVRSDPSIINYMNPSVAVSLPVFVIHGNHDDPTGATGLEALSALDVLAEAGLITYFGKVASSKRIELAPIMLTKGHTALALYGLGNVRDEVLYHTWAKEGNVKWLSPMTDTSVRETQRHDADDIDEDAGAGGRGNSDGEFRWFNLLVLHQNRVVRGTTKGISETLLPQWLDYVVWGHEHDSIPKLTHTTPPVVQPGSTVATSLSVGESKPKHAVLLEVWRGKLKHRIIPLQTVRNFRFHDVSLSESKAAEGSSLSETDPKTVTSFLDGIVRDMASEMEAEFDEKVSKFRTGAFVPEETGVKYPPDSYYIERLSRLVRQPLVRLRVEMSGNWEVPNPQRFGQEFLGRVASAADVLLFYRSKRRLKTTRTAFSGYSADGGITNGDGVDINGDDMEDEEDMMLTQNEGEQRDVVQIPKLVQYYLYHSKAGGTGLRFLELDRLTGAVDHFVNKAENKAISEYVSSYLKVQQDKTLDEVQKDTGLDETKLLEKFKEGANEAAKRVIREEAEKKRLALAQSEVDALVRANGTNGVDGDDNGTDSRTAHNDSIMRRAKDSMEPSASSRQVDDEDDEDGIGNNNHNGDLMIDGNGGGTSHKLEPQPASSNASAVVDDPGNVDFNIAMDDVHAVLTSVPKLAQQIENIRPLADDSDDDNGDDDGGGQSKPTRSRTATGRGARGGRGSRGGRGGRGRKTSTTTAGARTGRGIDSYMNKAPASAAAPAATSTTRRTTSRRSAALAASKANESIVLDSDNDEDEIQPQVTAPSRRLARARVQPQSQQQRSRRRPVSLEDDDDDDLVKEDEIKDDYNSDKDDDVDVEMEDYVQVTASARKRRPRTTAASGRASQRQRSDTASASLVSGGAATPRRSAFAERARTRRNTSTINVDEASGDDAM